MRKEAFGQAMNHCTLVQSLRIFSLNIFRLLQMDNRNLIQVIGLEWKAIDPKIIKPRYMVVTRVTFNPNTRGNEFNHVK